jgi:hypothetical protein
MNVQYEILQTCKSIPDELQQNINNEIESITKPDMFTMNQIIDVSNKNDKLVVKLSKLYNSISGHMTNDCSVLFCLIYLVL